jgi:putative endonuclease
LGFRRRFAPFGCGIRAHRAAFPRRFFSVARDRLRSASRDAVRIVAPIEKGDAMEELDRIESEDRPQPTEGDAAPAEPPCDEAAPQTAPAPQAGAGAAYAAGAVPAAEGCPPGPERAAGEAAPVGDGCASAYDTHHNKDLGARGEEAACAFLIRRGFDVLERNWVCAAGEADIIALEEDTLHFIEVKTRMSDARGFPAEAVDTAKRARYERIAELYLRSIEDGDDVCVTFDVISIIVTGEHRAFLRFHRNVLAGDCRPCA